MSDHHSADSCTDSFAKRIKLYTVETGAVEA